MMDYQLNTKTFLSEMHKVVKRPSLAKRNEFFPLGGIDRDAMWELMSLYFMLVIGSPHTNIGG